MNELVRHIEYLLLDNDCVVVPGFGGFIVEHKPAIWDNKEEIFLPPKRVIAFNPQLNMNDGMLVQTYMDAHATNFSDATKLMQKDVELLNEKLHREGEATLGNTGTIALSSRGQYTFTPDKANMVTPSLFGLDTFTMKDIEALAGTAEPHTPVRQTKTYDIRISRVFVRNFAAAVVGLLLFFSLTVPVGNTGVEEVNYANMLPATLFEQIAHQSVITTPVTAVPTVQQKAVTPQKAKVNKAVKPHKEAPKVAAAAAKPVHAAKPAKQAAVHKEKQSTPYYIIVASVNTQQIARQMVDKYRAKGYKDASVVAGNGKIRVSIAACATRKDATRELQRIRREVQRSAWLLVR
jgi:cell division septation protein DedD/nucleoid DNA-binding protein